MLRIKNLLFALFIVVSLVPQLSAQFDPLDVRDLSDAVIISFRADLDTTYTSEWFTLQRADDESFYTYPLSTIIKYNSATSKPRITTTIEMTNDKSNIITVDTLGLVSDSLETARYFDLNLNGKKGWLVRLKCTEESGNPADATLTGSIYLRRKDKK